MRSYVRVADQSEPTLIFHYGPFDTTVEAQKAAEKFKRCRLECGWNCEARASDEGRLSDHAARSIG
jgi:hypothetical protein